MTSIKIPLSGASALAFVGGADAGISAALTGNTATASAGSTRRFSSGVLVFPFAPVSRTLPRVGLGLISDVTSGAVGVVSWEQRFSTSRLPRRRAAA